MEDRIKEAQEERRKREKDIAGLQKQLAEVTTNGLGLERVDELTYLMRFDRAKHSSADVIRTLVNRLEIRDLFVEEEPIEEIVKRIYLSGEVA